MQARQFKYRIFRLLQFHELYFFIGMETSSVRSHQNSADSSAVATPTSASGGSNSNNFRSTPTAKSALRRAAIDIIGRGFVLWEPHLEVSKVRFYLFFKPRTSAFFFRRTILQCYNRNSAILNIFQSIRENF